MHSGESKELRSRFHQLQESIFFYQGWIATESKAMTQSDEHFVTVIKKVTGPLIKEAERQISVPKAPGALNKKMDKDLIAAASEAFLDDVRDHLSLWPWKHRSIGQCMGAIWVELRGR